MKNLTRTHTTKTTRIMALIIAMITALSAMSAITLSASAASDEIEYKGNVNNGKAYVEGRVYMKVNGTNGSTDWHYIFGGTTEDDTDFCFTDVNVGEIQSVSVQTNVPSTFEGLGQDAFSAFWYFDSWTIENVMVNGIKISCYTTIENTDEYTFNVTDNIYRVEIKTADVKKAGTDLNVYVTLNGTDGTSIEEFNMSNHGTSYTPSGIPVGNDFEQGSRTVAYIHVPFDVLESITIRLGGNAIAAKGWKCESITIEQIQSGTDSGVKTINVNQWFATEKDNTSCTFKV